MPDRVKSFIEVDSSKNRPRTRHGFVKPIRNGVTKIKNSNQRRPTKAETGKASRENRVGLQKDGKIE